MGRTYLFLGGSNTAADRFWLPETNGLGNGYVAQLRQKLAAREPDVRVINKGFDGFTVPALLRMLTRDGLPNAPDMICVLIGINDVGVAMNTGVSLAQQHFAEHCQALLTFLKTQSFASLLLLGPFLFPHPQEYAGWLACVREAQDIMAAAAADASVSFLPLQERMNRLAQQFGFDAVTRDGIHLTATGHRLLADIIYPHL